MTSYQIEIREATVYRGELQGVLPTRTQQAPWRTEDIADGGVQQSPDGSTEKSVYLEGPHGSWARREQRVSQHFFNSRVVQ